MVWENESRRTDQLPLPWLNQRQPECGRELHPARQRWFYPRNTTHSNSHNLRRMVPGGGAGGYCGMMRDVGNGESIQFLSLLAVRIELSSDAGSQAEDDGPSAFESRYCVCDGQEADAREWKGVDFVFDRRVFPPPLSTFTPVLIQPAICPPVCTCSWPYSQDGLDPRRPAVDALSAAIHLCPPPTSRIFICDPKITGQLRGGQG